MANVTDDCYESTIYRHISALSLGRPMFAIEPIASVVIYQLRQKRCLRFSFPRRLSHDDCECFVMPIFVEPLRVEGTVACLFNLVDSRTQVQFFLGVLYDVIQANRAFEGFCLQYLHFFNPGTTRKKYSQLIQALDELAW
jgi:hypothetical protein